MLSLPEQRKIVINIKITTGKKMFSNVIRI